MNISESTGIDLIFPHTSVSYSRIARGINAGLWMDEGGDILGNDEDVIRSAARTGARIVIRH